MADSYFLCKGNKFLDANDQFSLPTIYGVKDRIQPSVEFSSKDEAEAKALTLGVPTAQLKIICVPKRENTEK